MPIRNIIILKKHPPIPIKNILTTPLLFEIFISHSTFPRTGNKLIHMYALPQILGPIPILTLDILEPSINAKNICPNSCTTRETIIEIAKHITNSTYYRHLHEKAFLIAFFFKKILLIVTMLDIHVTITNSIKTLFKFSALVLYIYNAIQTLIIVLHVRIKYISIFLVALKIISLFL